MNNSATPQQLGALTQIGASVVSCTYVIGKYDSNEANLDLVNVYFDGVAVPRDDGCAQSQGWTWIDNTRTAIEFCDEACSILETGGADEISILIMCSEGEVVLI